MTSLSGVRITLGPIIFIMVALIMSLRVMILIASVLSLSHRGGRVALHLSRVDEHVGRRPLSAGISDRAVHWLLVALVFRVRHVGLVVRLRRLLITLILVVSLRRRTLVVLVIGSVAVVTIARRSSSSRPSIRIGVKKPRIGSIIRTSIEISRPSPWVLIPRNRTIRGATLIIRVPWVLILERRSESPLLLVIWTRDVRLLSIRNP
jgi:hypothetical protein